MRGFRGNMFGGDAFRMGRKFAAGDLQLVILALLDEQPRHGYELIKTLEERSGGFYAPSPGVIYPALTYLEETGLADVETDGAKKLYRITEAGRRKVAENRSMIDLTMEKLEQIGAKMAQVRRVFDPHHRGHERDDEPYAQDNSEVATARTLLKSALKLRYPWSKTEAHRIAGILERAAAEILQGGKDKEERA